MLPFLAEIWELVTAIRIQERVGGLFGIGHYTLLFLPLCLPVSELQQPKSEIWDVGPRPQGEQIDNPDVAGFRANRTRLGFSAGHMKQTSRRAELSARS